MITRKKKIVLAALALAALITGLTLSALLATMANTMMSPNTFATGSRG